MEKPLVRMGQTLKDLRKMPEAVTMRVTKAKERRLERGDRGKVDDTEYVVGGGNAYEDLGFTDAEERFAKLKLAAQINEIIKENGWTQKAAALKLGTQQPEISNLIRGRLRSITYDRLVDWLITLGYSVEIKVKRSKNPHVEVAIAV
ncbi:MAG: helix-turn-helix domain-containing protein [Gemmatimonadaceae bacterium]|nr:helix-turn-helix domain-containing protein [Gemmatimonadaceae bacterium]